MNDEITVARAAEALGTDTEFIDVMIGPDEHIERYGVWNAETCIALTIALMIDDDARAASVCWAAVCKRRPERRYICKLTILDRGAISVGLRASRAVSFALRLRVH